MKCPKCNGTGEYEPFDTDVELDKLYPTEQANVEWLRSATFEEIANEIHKWYIFGYAMGVSGVKRNSITGVVEWLKQPHKE